MRKRDDIWASLEMAKEYYADGVIFDLSITDSERKLEEEDIVSNGFRMVRKRFGNYLVSAIFEREKNV